MNSTGSVGGKVRYVSYASLLWRPFFILVSVLVAVALAYFAVLSVSASEVGIGPVLIGFEARPAWRGESSVEVSPAGSLSAETHRTPVKLVFTVKEIAVDQAGELTRSGSPARESLSDWRGPVEARARALLYKLVAVAAAVAAMTIWLILRRWRWALAGAALGALAVLTLSWLTWATFDLGAFAEPRYTGSLAQAPEVIDFSQEVLANLDEYSDQVPRIAESLYRTINELQKLPADVPLDDAIRLLHVSDLHDSEAGAELLERVANLYEVDLVVDTGDIAELGLPFELDYPSSYLPLDVPYIWIGGNHDNPAVMETMKQIQGVTVLEDSFTEVDGLRIAGFADPSAGDILPRPATASMLEENQRLIEATLAANPPPPQIVAVHDPGQGRLLAGEVQVVLSGHTHMDAIEVVDGTVMATVGSTGAGGLRGFGNGNESPSSLQVLYFDRGSQDLLVIDTIVIYGFSQEFQVSRRVFRMVGRPLPRD